VIYKLRYTLLKKQVYAFSSEKLEVGDHVVAELDREKYMAIIHEEVQDHVVSSSLLGENNVIRKALEADEIHYDLQARRCFHFTAKANEIARKNESSCRIVTCEPLFDIERIIFYFKVFEKEINLRPVIKDVQELVKAQVDFRLVEGRDVAKLLPTIGACGIQTCCTKFLHTTPILSSEDVKDMWKRPTDNLGVCGRIKCCATFEKRKAGGESSCSKGGCGSCGTKASQ
jgi:cell fate regulator YaaT (PSP1 superfamily)